MSLHSSMAKKHYRHWRCKASCLLLPISRHCILALLFKHTLSCPFLRILLGFAIDTIDYRNWRRSCSLLWCSLIWSKGPSSLFYFCPFFHFGQHVAHFLLCYLIFHIEALSQKIYRQWMSGELDSSIYSSITLGKTSCAVSAETLPLNIDLLFHVSKSFASLLEDVT